MQENKDLDQITPLNRRQLEKVQGGRMTVYEYLTCTHPNGQNANTFPVVSLADAQATAYAYMEVGYTNCGLVTS